MWLLYYEDNSPLPFVNVEMMNCFPLLFYGIEIFSMLSSARAWTSIILVKKGDSRWYSTTSNPALRAPA